MDQKKILDLQYVNKVSCDAKKKYIKPEFKILGNIESQTGSTPIYM